MKVAPADVACPSGEVTTTPLRGGRPRSRDRSTGVSGAQPVLELGRDAVRLLLQPPLADEDLLAGEDEQRAAEVDDGKDDNQ